MNQSYLTTGEVADYLQKKGIKVAAGTIENKRRTGDGIPYRKFGRMVRYCPEDVDAWLAKAPLMTSTSDRGQQ